MVDKDATSVCKKSFVLSRKESWPAKTEERDTPQVRHLKLFLAGEVECARKLNQHASNLYTHHTHFLLFSIGFDFRLQTSFWKLEAVFERGLKF